MYPAWPVTPLTVAIIDHPKKTSWGGTTNNAITRGPTTVAPKFINMCSNFDVDLIFKNNL